MYGNFVTRMMQWYCGYLYAMQMVYMISKCKKQKECPVLILLGQHMLPLFCANQTERIPLANLVPLPEQQHDKEPRKHLNKRHGAISPREADSFDPLVDIKRHRQAEADAERVEHNGRLFDVVGEALRQVVDSDGRDAQRAKRDEDLGEAQHAPREVLIEAVAKDAEAERVADERRQP